MDNKDIQIGVEEAAQQLVDALKQNLISLGKSATGDLVRSIDFEIVKTATGITANIIANDYLEQVDRGRRKGKMPPVIALIPWVKRRGIKVKGKTDREVAFGIAWSIKKKGIKATNVIERTQQQLIKNIEDIIAAAALKQLGDLIDETFKDIK